jgi:Putative auto-transporter adhesin, head GIN domain
LISVKLYYSLLTTIAILCFAFLPTAGAQPELPAPQPTKMVQKLVDFKTISVRGPIKLMLEQSTAEAGNFLQIVGEQQSPVSVSVKNDTLYLQAEPSDQPSTVRVGVHQLYQLIVDGGASVSGQPLNSTSLSIDANTSGNIELRGMINLDRILSAGSGLVSVQWIDSPQLRVDGSDHSQIQLAGVAGAVEMRLRDESLFQGQYLRIDRIFVQTKDFSTAKLLVNDSLRAFAYDQSNIYYYKRPAQMTEFTAGSGNILQLGWGK